MRKLIRFTVNQNRPLTPVEMTEVNGGGEFISTYCYHLNDSCAIPKEGGFVLGKCEWESPSSGTLVCRP